MLFIKTTVSSILENGRIVNIMARAASSIEMADSMLLGDRNMGKKHGRGVEKFESGAISKGNFWNDAIYGHGVLTLGNGTVIEKDWGESEVSWIGTPEKD